jgi:uncharacterized metal-binding protein
MGELEMEKKVVVLPCSGIGKAFGEIGRQAVYELVEDLRPGDVTTACLGRLMIDDPEAKALLQDKIVITIDGCTQDCARKTVESSGKKVECALRVIEAIKKNRGLKPEGVLELGEPGFKLVHILAQRLNEEVDRVMRKGQ